MVLAETKNKSYNVYKLSQELKKVTDCSSIKSLACRTGILESKIKCAINGTGPKRLNSIELLELLSAVGLDSKEVFNIIY